MVQQAADVRMMQCLCGGGIAVSLCDVRIGHEGLEQPSQMRILQRGYEVAQAFPKFINVLSCFWEVVSEFDFCIGQSAQLMNGELKTILVLVQQALNFEKVILLKGVESTLHVVPHFGFKLTAAIAQDEREIRLARLLGFHLFRHHNEAGNDDLIFLLGAIADEEIFHATSVGSKRGIKMVPRRTSSKCVRRSLEQPLALSQNSRSFFFFFRFLAAASLLAVSTGLV